MAGFANARRLADAQDAGQYLYASFRKQATQNTGSGVWFDLSMSPGNPAPNYYIGAVGAFTPMRQSTDGGLRHGGNVSPAKKFLRKLLVQTATASATPCQLLLLDYIGFYGFIDESVLDPQPLDNTTPLPRHADGLGVMMMPVVVAGQTGGQTFTVSYTNQDGVAGRTTQATFTKAVSGGGVIVTSNTNAVAGSLPFVNLQAGDKSARSVESVTFSAAGGGLMAIVIVRPIFHTLATQECRRTTTGNLESYGAATHMEALIHMPINEVKRGAVLGVIGLGNAGSLASSILTGVLTTQWSN